jgi:transcriptional/translational regulatory protein YebC/TACO1
MGETGSVGFMFDRLAEVYYPADKASADEMFEAALEAGAENVESDDEGHQITCPPEDFATVRDTLEAKYGEPERQGLVWQPNVQSDVDLDTARSVMNLIDTLEDNDDVQTVTTNANFSDDIMEKLMAEEG